MVHARFGTKRCGTRATELSVLSIFIKSNRSSVLKTILNVQPAFSFTRRTTLNTIWLAALVVAAYLFSNNVGNVQQHCSLICCVGCNSRTLQLDAAASITTNTCHFLIAHRVRHGTASPCSTEFRCLAKIFT
jgi:hypothetical protein